MIIGFHFLVTGYAFQASDSVIASSCSSAGCGNTSTVLQLTGTLFVIAGVVIQAIGFLKYTRTRFTSRTRS